MSYEPACQLDDLWVGELRAIETSGPRVLLVRLDAGVFAYVDRCPHQGIALSEGHLHGAELTCDAHGWRFDLTTGRGINPRDTCLTPVPLRIDAGRVTLDVGADA
jgi:toluene monooxygenase system ferredoxin subunit